MKVLIGTTNPSKVKRFVDLLSGYDVDFCTLKDLNITAEPDEKGKTPEENAIIKAKFYSAYYDAVICNDSGLYFEELPLTDSRQPGLNIRTPDGNKRLNDDEMIEYYANLISSLGGEVTAFYLDGIAVYYKGKITSFMDAGKTTRTDSFFMVSEASPKRHEGWPLDSLSIRKNTNKYFVDSEVSESKDNIFIDDYRSRIINFLADSLGLSKK
ncbi:MAG: non-canonical purine NTP pyrophosphatase [Oscillospiraceae bacterium]|nr:non-canonical purine NTP pyrophosphatase [Oscillospiraceae bacterium]